MRLNYFFFFMQTLYVYADAVILPCFVMKLWAVDEEEED